MAPDLPLLSESVLSAQVACVSVLTPDEALSEARAVAALIGCSVLEALAWMREQGRRGGRT